MRPSTLSQVDKVAAQDTDSLKNELQTDKLDFAAISRNTWSWGTIWSAVGAVGTIMAALIAYQTWLSPRHEAEARVNIVGVARTPSNDDSTFVSFAVNCILNNSGTMAISLSSAVPYAVPLTQGLPEMALLKTGVDPLSNRILHLEPGKQEAFQVLVYMERSFLEAGQSQQLPSSGQQDPAWHPAAATLVKLRFEAESIDGKYWGATSPPQLFAFENTQPVVAHPKQTAILLQPIAEPVHRNMFQ